MRDTERWRFEAFERVKQFSLDNSTDFPNGSIQKINMNKIITEIGLLEGYMVQQVSGGGDAGQAFEVKDTARENIRELMKDIADTAKVMEYAIDGIADKFRMPYNQTDQNMLATARSWVDEATGYETEFIQYGLQADFLTLLNDAAEAFDASMTAPVTAIDQRVAATALIGESIRRGMIALRICDTVMRNNYFDQPGKLAAWISASHVERAPKKRPPTP